MTVDLFFTYNLGISRVGVWNRKPSSVDFIGLDTESIGKKMFLR